MKKKITALFTAALLFVSFMSASAAALDSSEQFTDTQPITAVPEWPAQTDDFVLPAADVTPETAAQSAAFLLKVISADVQGDENNRTYSYNTEIELSEPTLFYDCFGNVTQYHFTFTTKGETEQTGYILISAHSDLPLVTEFNLGESPYTLEEGETMFFADSYIFFIKSADGSYTDRYGFSRHESYVVDEFDYYAQYRDWLTRHNPDYILDIEEANEALITAMNEAEKLPTFRDRLTAFFEYIIDFFREYLEYALFDVFFAPEEPENIPEEIEKELLLFAGKNGCYLTECHFIDKSTLVPRYQDDFAGDYEIGSGICGVASWMMLLDYYRDGLGYTNIPDDEQMFDDLMAIFDEITAELSPIASLAQDICVLIEEKTDRTLGIPENSYEVIYALDAGIAEYLHNLGYDDLAFNCVKNLNFSIPVLTPTANALLLKDVRSTISDWLYEQTDGKLNISLTLNRSAENVAEQSLKRSEPIVIGNWLSLGSNSLTNHYFLGTGYCKLTYEYEYNGKVIYTAEKTLIEIYDTWGSSHTSYIDWDVLKSTCLYDINSLASLG